MSGKRHVKDSRHRGRKKSERRIWILVFLVLLAVFAVCLAAERISVGNGKADGYSEEAVSGEAKTESTMEGSTESAGGGEWHPGSGTRGTHHGRADRGERGADPGDEDPGGDPVVPL